MLTQAVSMIDRLSELTFGKRPPTELPSSVGQRIADSQRLSEVLVCIVQFSAVVFFAVFYHLTPKGFSPGVPYEPVPWALAFYALFTGFRLSLALRDRLGPTMLGLSVIVDVAVLMITIWSFHLQYQQPPSIYLKAPTLLYVFILIALRTLRLEASYVVLAGVVAALGWTALVAYAGLWSGTAPITHNFAVYTTSHAILIGAEVDKLISISVVTAVLAVAVVRARRLLIQSVAEAHAASELSRFFAPEVASEIRSADIDLRPGAAHFTEAAIIVLDLRNFTSITRQLSPAATIALLTGFQHCVVPVLQRHGGAIDKYLGDGIMATFGAARSSATYASDAFRAVEELLTEVDAWNAGRRAAGEEPIGIGVAVTIDRVLFGVMGDASRLEFTVIGNAVNVAAKLEKHCKILGHPVVAPASALNRARSQGYNPACPILEFAGQRVTGIGEVMELIAFGPGHLAG